MTVDGLIPWPCTPPEPVVRPAPLPFCQRTWKLLCHKSVRSVLPVIVTLASGPGFQSTR